MGARAQAFTRLGQPLASRGSTPSPVSRKVPSLPLIWPETGPSGAGVREAASSNKRPPPPFAPFHTPSKNRDATRPLPETTAPAPVSPANGLAPTYARSPSTITRHPSSPSANRLRAPRNLFSNRRRARGSRVPSARLVTTRRRTVDRSDLSRGSSRKMGAMTSSECRAPAMSRTTSRGSVWRPSSSTRWTIEG